MSRYKYLGDFKHITDGEIKEHIGIVVLVICRYFRGTVRENPANWDDVFSCGLIGLWKGLESYDESMGVKKSYYLSKTIRNSILHLWVKKEHRWSKLKFESDYEQGEGNQNSIIDSDLVLDKPYDETENPITDLELKLIQALKNYATDIQRQIIDTLAKGYTFTETCKILNRSRSVVSSHIAVLRAKLKANFAPRMIENGIKKKYFS